MNSCKSRITCTWSSSHHRALWSWNCELDTWSQTLVYDSYSTPQSHDHCLQPSLLASHKQSHWESQQGKLQVTLVSPPGFPVIAPCRRGPDLPAFTPYHDIHPPALLHLYAACTRSPNPQRPPTHMWPALALLWQLPLFLTRDSCCFLLNDLHILGLRWQLGLLRLLLLSDMVTWCHIFRLHCLVLAIPVPIAIKTKVLAVCVAACYKGLYGFILTN